MAFQNPFLSLAGQKERISNVGAVLASSLNPFDKTKVVANTPSKTTNAALEFGANNPFTTAALVAAPFSSGVKSAVSSAIGKLGLGTKVAAAAAATVAVPALATSEKARVAAINVASGLSAEKLVALGAQSGNLIDNPTLAGAKDLLSQNKVLAAAGGVALIAAIPAAASTIATFTNTQAVRENSKLAAASLSSAKDASTPKEPPLPAQPVTSTAQGGAPSTANVMAAAPPVAATPDSPAKISPQPRIATRRKKRKAYKCAPLRGVHGTFNLKLG